VLDRFPCTALHKNVACATVCAREDVGMAQTLITFAAERGDEPKSIRQRFMK
jgi:hypothetical protein